jgi:hypothetical protein
MEAVLSQTREKFATQVSSATLTAVRALAESEGRQLQAWTAARACHGGLSGKSRDLRYALQKIG